MTEDERAALVEELAAIEHQRWSDWQSWCHQVLRENCPSPELEVVLERWDRQIATPYSALTEREKQSDREQVERYMPIIDRLLAAADADVPWSTVEKVRTYLGSFLADVGGSHEHYLNLRDNYTAGIIATIRTDTRAVAQATATQEGTSDEFE